ncbi:MAG: HzsA-related protein [Planctomycetota bacterium]
MKRAVLVTLICLSLVNSALSSIESVFGPSPLRPDELAFDEILFIKRPTFASDHFYTDFINGCESDQFRNDNGIYIYNLKEKTITPVITAADMASQTGSDDGIFYGFDLSFDAKRVVFDYKPSIEEGFRIWQCNIDGSGLHQLTFTPPDEKNNIVEYNLNDRLFNFHYDDMHPCYAPDDHIIFTSTRCKYTTLCDYTGILVTPVLHRIELDGSNMEKLSDSPVSEFCPTVMPDGRIMYTRWEYVDKSSVRIKVLMAMRPDGTMPEELFGLDHMDPAAIMYGRVVPGESNLITAIGCPHCPQGSSLGELMLINTRKNVRTTEAVTRITKDVRMNHEGGWEFQTDERWKRDRSGRSGRLYGTPYPVNASTFMVSCKFNKSERWNDLDAYDLYLIDDKGNHTLIYGEEDTSCWHPVPLIVRDKPETIYGPKNQELAKANQAMCVVTDVYGGMEGVERGDVKYLRVNIAVSRPWSSHRIPLWGRLGGDDHIDPIFASTGWRGASWPRVQLGVVPVEEDGSACFIVPADENIQLQALDENYMEIQRERTYFNMKPGEVRSCIGCHERRKSAPSNTKSENVPVALQKTPSIPAPQPGERAGQGKWAGWGTNVIHYENDIQPIWDKQRAGGSCVSCHSGNEPAAGLNLSGELTDAYCVSYEYLTNLGRPPGRLGYPKWQRGTRYLGLIIGEVGLHEQEEDNNGAYYDPYTIGSHTSYLAGVLSGKHDKLLSSKHGGKLTKEEMIQVVTWIDSNAQYYGSYYGKHHIAYQDKSGFRTLPTFEEAIDEVAPAWHGEGYE